MTAEEFFALPDELPFAQLVDGEIVVAPAPSLGHDEVVRRLVVAHHMFALAHPTAAGHLGFGGGLAVSEHSGYVPDAFWAPVGPGLTPENRHRVPPPLVVEVLSPSNRRFDLSRKWRDYLAAGVEEVWLVDPDASTVAVHRARAGAAVVLGGGDTLTTPLVPGWEVDLSALLSAR
jgi:Uma2 family endonuclease